MEDNIMIPVKIVLHGHLCQIVGGGSLSLSVPVQLSLAIEKLCADFPQLSGLIKTGSYMLVLNGFNLIGQNLQKIDLSAGDELTIIPFVAGG